MPNTSSPKASRAEASMAESLEDFYRELDFYKDAFVRAGICVIHQDLIWWFWGWRVVAFPVLG